MLSQQIAQWMKGVLAGTPAKGFVFGLSGGIDSAVVGGLAKLAVGDAHLGLIMPCHSADADKKDAIEIAEILDLKTEIVDLSSLLDQFLKLLPETDRVQIGNIKARLRMITLYHYASRLNYLVAGTGNKIEYLLGYFTKYGDGAFDIAPLQDLLKRDVRLVGRELGLPDPLVFRPPSAGLWEGQTDEEEIGLTYEVMDQAITGLERGSSIVPFKAMEKVLQMNKMSEHKRISPPKFIKPRDL